MPPERIVLHVGMHKTGTTYLQNRMNLNRAALAEHGIHYPGGRDGVSQMLAVYDLQGKRPRGHEDTRVAGAWEALTADILAADAKVAFVSHEALGFSTLRQARTAVAGFTGCDVHVIVTARDLGRVLVSMWQEEVKNDRTWTWRAYVDAAKDPAQASQLPALGFWRRADPIRVCDTWAAVVGADHVHVVTVPQPGAAPDELVRRVGSVVGFGVADIPAEPAWSNEMVGAAGTEVLRRVNEELGGRLNQAQHTRAIRRTLVPLLVSGSDQRRLGLPDEELAWVSERAEQMITDIRAREYDVVGALDELRPRPPGDLPAPDQVVDDDLLAASVQALALLTERYATAWWTRKGESVESGAEEGDLASRARGRLYRGKERIVALTERNTLAAKVLGRALLAEERRVARARERKDGS